MLISPVIPMIYIYRLPHGQYGYKGHVINLPQDVAGFVNTLSCHPSELDIILVKHPEISQPHQHFRVRRSVVLRALQFLIANNIYFNNITLNQDNLLILPDDDCISNAHIFTVDCNSVSSTFDTSEQCNTEEDPEHITTTFVPGNYRSMTRGKHKEVIRRILFQFCHMAYQRPQPD